jgi:hypothetical protein
MISLYLSTAGDNYAPANSKPELQQYCPYQNYNLHCVDVSYQLTKNNIFIGNSVEQQKSFLAVDAYDPNVIKCDFNQIANDYH